MKEPLIIQNLKIAADLSDAALENARWQLIELIPFMKTDYVWYTLLIPSQSIPVALWLSIKNQLPVEIDPTLEPDAWKLQASFWNKSTKQLSEIQIFSPGA